MSIDLVWVGDENREELQAGQVQSPVAAIYRSGGGKRWAVTYELPGISLSSRQWWPKNELKYEVTKAIREWFERATAARLGHWT